MIPFLATKQTKFVKFGSKKAHKKESEDFLRVIIIILFFVFFKNIYKFINFYKQLATEEFVLGVVNVALILRILVIGTTVMTK